MTFQESKKNGYFRGLQRYKCLDCNHIFNNKRRDHETNTSKKIWQDYIDHKQTVQELCQQHSVSHPTIEKYLDNYQITKEIVYPSQAVVVMDTTYFGRGFGVIIFRDPNRRINLYWQYVIYETVDAYRQGIEHIISQGCSVSGIVCDGKKGLFSAFPGIPIQMCQFHQKQIITRYLTCNPKLQAGIELQKIVDSMTSSCEEVFSMLIEVWMLKWNQFLKEKTYSDTGKWCYTHRKLRSAIRSIKSNLPYLFTFQKYPELHIPNTTNSLEGINSALKFKIKAHQGINSHRRKKIIDYLLAK